MTQGAVAALHIGPHANSGDTMSRDAIATAYAKILDDEDCRNRVARSEGALSDWDLTATEEHLLREEAYAAVPASDRGPVMSYLRNGPPLSQRVASQLGIALNKAHGLPTVSLQEPGYRGSGECCAWGHPKIPCVRGKHE